MHERSVLAKVAHNRPISKENGKPPDDQQPDRANLGGLARRGLRHVDSVYEKRNQTGDSPVRAVHQWAQADVASLLA